MWPCLLDFFTVLKVTHIVASVSFRFMCFGALLLGAYIFVIVVSS